MDGSPRENNSSQPGIVFSAKIELTFGPLFEQRTNKMSLIPLSDRFINILLNNIKSTNRGYFFANFEFLYIQD